MLALQLPGPTPPANHLTGSDLASTTDTNLRLTPELVVTSPSEASDPPAIPTTASSLGRLPTAHTSPPLPAQDGASSADIVGGHQEPASGKSTGSLVPTSLLSLPDYRKTPCKFFYPVKDTDTLSKDTDTLSEVLSDHVEQNPRIEMWHHPLSQGGRSFVQVAKFYNDNEDHDWLVSKLRKLESSVTQEVVLKEYEILQRIHHPHILAAVGAYKEVFGVDDDSWDSYDVWVGILLYPYCPNTLAQLIRIFSTYNRDTNIDEIKRRKCAQQLLSYFPCLCHAILHLHQKRIKHKDIKTDNILIDRYKTVILADFDLSDQYNNSEDLISIGKIVGTPANIPDAVQNGKPRGLERDINCLGFVFLELATVLFGETTEAFIQFTKHRANISPEGRPPPYRDSLRDGHLVEWVERLRKIACKDSGKVPIRLTGRAADEFLDMIVQMMNADVEQQHMLEPAMKLFRQVYGDVCKHCNLSVSIILPALTCMVSLTFSKDEQEQSEIRARPLSVLAGASRPLTTPELSKPSTGVRVAAADDTTQSIGERRNDESTNGRSDTPLPNDSHQSPLHEQTLLDERPIAQTGDEFPNPSGYRHRSNSDGPRHRQPTQEHDGGTNDKTPTCSNDSLDSSEPVARHPNVIHIGSDDSLDALRAKINGHFVCISYSPNKHKVKFVGSLGRGQYTSLTIRFPSTNTLGQISAHGLCAW